MKWNNGGREIKVPAYTNPLYDIMRNGGEGIHQEVEVRNKMCHPIASIEVVEGWGFRKERVTITIVLRIQNQKHGRRGTRAQSRGSHRSRE